MKILILLPIFHLALCQSKTDLILKERQKSLDLVLGDETDVLVDIQRPNGIDYNDTIELNLQVETDNEELAEMISPTTLKLAHGSSFAIRIKGKSIGIVKMAINVTSSDANIQVKNSGLYFIIAIGHCKSVKYVSIILGWLYVILWNLSFYPQVIHNFRHRSVIGMHFDFLTFNTLGFTCYLIYNIGLYSIPTIEEEYHKRHPFGANPVEFNDLFFPLHAVVLCITGIFQCCLYQVTSIF